MTERTTRAPRRAYIVSHTHWDREWYRTFHDFRGDLTRIVRQVLDRLEADGPFRHFVLDGQSVVLEDHLEIYPEDRPRIEALVRAGRLAVGPWYILPDEFLVSGEATVRNLIVGRRVALEVGGVQPVGYMPDSFGHIAQLPQLLRRAGIDSFVYTRGHGDEIDRLGLEYRWQSPDGSTVLAIHQCGGYANAASLGHAEVWHAHTQREIDIERAVRQVAALFEKMGPRSRCDVWLLNNGCDHFPPQRDFARVLEALQAAFPETEFVHAGLADFIDAVRDEGAPTEVWQGELLGGKHHHILSGVWSARMPLKQRNDACQELLAGIAEPLLAYAHFMLDQPYPQGALEYAWKRLLRNHPHDSICGCSIDEVHREMLARFDGVEQTAEQLVRRCLETIAPTFACHATDDDETVICVANPLPETRAAVVERLVVLQPPGASADALRLVDEAGNDVPCVVRERQFVERFWGIDYRKELDVRRQSERFDVYRERFGDRILRDEGRRDDSDCFVFLEFLARDLPPLGHRNYRLRIDEGPPPTPIDEVRCDGDTIENELVRVHLHPDGRFDLTQDPRGPEPRTWKGLNRLEDAEDIGDEYDYSPAERSETHRLAGRDADADADTGRVVVLAEGPFAARLETRVVWSLPARVTADRTARSTDRVACPVTVRVGLRAADPVVDVELLFDNRARDHRLRVAFPTDIRSETIVADGQFLIHERPLRPPTGDDWLQPSPGTWPQQEFSLVADAAGGLAVLNRGLPEIEAVAETGGAVTLHLTLLRAVEWLSRDDFPTRRRQNAGPTLYTPDAQCLGEQSFRYGLLPFALDGTPAGVVVKAASRRWRTPPVSIQGVADGATPGAAGLVQRATTATAISAVKRHDRRDTLVVRLYNLTAAPVDETLTFGRAVTAAWQVDLHEEREAPIDVTNARAVRVPLGPHAIATAEVAFAS